MWMGRGLCVYGCSLDTFCLVLSLRILAHSHRPRKHPSCTSSHADYTMRTVQYRSLQTAAMRTGSGMGRFLSLTARDATTCADTYFPRQRKLTRHPRASRLPHALPRQITRTRTVRVLTIKRSLAHRCRERVI